MVFSTLVSAVLGLEEQRVSAALKLLDEGNTVPFIARYRKDVTGELTDEQLYEIEGRYKYFQELQERKETVINTIQEQGKMTPELLAQINTCVDKTKLEDIYLPYKPKKRTRATIAREKGLEPLALIIMAQEASSNTDEEIARIYCSEENGIASPKAAIEGALDIIAEEIAEKAEYRQELRRRGEEEGILVASVRKEFENQKTKFENYYDFKEAVKKMPSHRVMAIRRGEKEKVLRYSIEIEGDTYVAWLCNQVIKSASIWKTWLEQCCKDAYERLMLPSVETEVRMNIRQKAEEVAIKEVFAENLKAVMLAAPAGQKVVLALDPGLRTGCKVAVVDETGKFLDHTVIYPHTGGAAAKSDSKKILRSLVKQYNVDIICIGNGTASRETHAFASDAMEGIEKRPIIVVVSEAGASVYSASEIARTEFPDLDVTTRGAISIARRTQDPLAEIVKVDPKAIGVGQYQHDVNQTQLGQTLGQVVESCVNHVGVDVNLASAPLLSYVAGINKSLANNIVKHRDSNGAFSSRQDLLKVSGFGPKAFEQAAGFLRIHGAANPLDNSAVHPENYAFVQDLSKDLGLEVNQILGNTEVLRQVKPEQYAEKVGIHTLKDILSELEKPGRDPRSEFRYARFDDKVQDIQDLVTGSWMEGVVTNVTNFGAFVDVGVHQDGLVHISEMSDSFVQDAKTVLKVGDIVRARVIAVDVGQKRIALSMKADTPVEKSPVRGPKGKTNDRNAPNKGMKIQPTATLADLKKKLAGGDVKKVQPVKPQISMKALMKKGK